MKFEHLLEFIILFFISSKFRLIQRSDYVCTDNAVEVIELQNREYYHLYDELAKHLTKKEQIEILNSNGQLIPETKHEVNIESMYKNTRF